MAAKIAVSNKNQQMFFFMDSSMVNKKIQDAGNHVKTYKIVSVFKSSKL